MIEDWVRRLHPLVAVPIALALLLFWIGLYLCMFIQSVGMLIGGGLSIYLYSIGYEGMTIKYLFTGLLYIVLGLIGVGMWIHWTKDTLIGFRDMYRESKEKKK